MFVPASASMCDNPPCPPVIVDDAKFTVKLITPIAMAEKLNFAIREGGRTVGAGVVTKIIE